MQGTLLTVYHPALVDQSWEQTLSGAVDAEGTLICTPVMRAVLYGDGTLEKAAHSNLFWFS